jgi:hydroxymethylbilane synthase
MILAAAGVKRLGLEKRIGEHLSVDTMMPAVGQGALAIELRGDDAEMATLVEALNHQPTLVATTAERALLRELEGGCQVPIGAYARVESGASLHISAMVAALDGSELVRGTRSGEASQPEAAGKGLALDLLSRGADRILGQIRATGAARA